MALHKLQYTVATGDAAGSPFDAVTATSRARYTALAALLVRPVVLEAIQKAIAADTTPSIKVSISELTTVLNTGLDA